MWRPAERDLRPGIMNATLARDERRMNGRSTDDERRMIGGGAAKGVARVRRSVLDRPSLYDGVSSLGPLCLPVRCDALHRDTLSPAQSENVRTLLERLSRLAEQEMVIA